MTDLFVKITEFSHDVENSDRVATDWITVESNSDISARGSCTLAELSFSVEDALDGSSFEKVIVFLPDELALFCRVSVPGRTVSQMRRALPYVVESFVVQDIEELHIATTELRRNRPVDTLSIDKSKFQTLVNMLVESNVSPTYISTVGSHLASERDTVVVATDGMKLILKSEDELAVVDSEHVLDSVSLLLSKSMDESPIKLEVIAAADSLRLEFEQLASIETINYRNLESDLLAEIALNFNPKDGVNLAQGAFATDGNDRSIARQWGLTAALAAAGFLFYTGIVFSQGLWAKFHAKNVLAESTQLYESIYGSSPGNRHPANRMRTKFGQAVSERSTIQDLLGVVADELARSKAGIHLNSIVFNDSTKEMRLGFEVDDFNRLEKLQASLQSGIINAEILSAEQRQAHIYANLTLSLAQ